METTMKIEYRRQGESSIGAWQPLTNLDELIWNGVYALRMSGDDNTSGLPFRVDDNDSMTFVVKDHAHDGRLQNNRTIVQTITRVERTTGRVSVYNRTRHYSNGSHSWTDWKLACDDNGAPTIDDETVQRSKKNENDIANEIIRAKSMDEGLDAKVTANTTAISNEINRAQNMEQNIKSSLRSTTPRVHRGALQENSDPYPGTSYSAYSDPVTGNGEIVVSDKYIIDTIKMFAKDGTPWGYTDNYNGESFTIDDNFDYQLGFRRKDNGKFTSDELKRVVQSFIIDTIVWGAGKDLNNYRCAGEYSIEGKRENTADNMPIYNIGNINARLTVLNAGGCVTQVLTLLNIGGGDSNIYTRTMQNGTWSMWNKLQSNVGVGAIGLGQTRTFDHLTDNGIYSGVNVYATGTDDNGYPITAFETFVLITINAYLTGGGVSQLKYSLLPDGTTTVAKRSKQENTWSEWNDVGNHEQTKELISTETQRAKIIEEELQKSITDNKLNIDANTEKLKALDPQQTLLCSNYLYTNNGIENAVSKIYYLTEQDNETIKGAFVTGMIVNVLGTGTLSLYLSNNIELKNRTETLIEEIDITQLGVQVIRFSNPVVVGVKQTFGFKMGFKHAVSTTYGASGYMGVRYLNNDSLSLSNKDFGFGLVGMKRYESADKYPVTRGILGSFLCRTNPYYDHLFIDKINGENVIIPSESIYSVAISKRLGFDMLELNVKATSDAQFVVMHGDGEKFGKQFEHVDGITDISATAINSVTLAWIKENVRYKSIYAKYRTAPSTLEEMLYECKRNGIIPFVQRIDIKVDNVWTNSIPVADRIMGEGNYVSYGGAAKRETSALIYYYGAESNINDILAICNKYGAPFIYGINGVTKFTDDELRNIVDTLHNKGYFVGFAGCYQNEPLNQKLLNMGFDVSASGWNVPVFTDSNIVCADSFDQFTHNGTVNDSELTLSVGNTVSIAHSGNIPFLSVGLLQIRFTGKLNIKMGDYINDEFVSDGDSAMTLTTYYMEKAPVFSITAVEGTTIKDILFKAAKR